MEMHTTYLHLGSNQGDRQHMLAEARRYIAARVGLVVKCSHVYETAPWGVEEQADFYNQALMVRTELDVEELLQETQKIERLLGRAPNKRWHERPIDIDIIFFDNVIFRNRELVVPHRHLHLRNFVLIPLMEIAPSFIHPQLNRTIEQLLAASPDHQEVAILERG